jgi:hypothetical protein
LFATLVVLRQTHPNIEGDFSSRPGVAQVEMFAGAGVQYRLTTKPPWRSANKPPLTS